MMNDQSEKYDGEMLKPCPFCGAPASAWSWNGGARVDCTLRDATTDEVICWHYCLRFDSPDEDVQFRYFDMMKRAMFKEKDGDHHEG